MYGQTTYTGQQLQFNIVMHAISTHSLINLNSIEGIGGYHICQAHVEHRGAAIEAIQEYPVYREEPHQDFISYVSM